MRKLFFWFYAGGCKTLNELTFRRITRKKIHLIFISSMISTKDGYPKNKLLVSYKDIRIYNKEFYFTSILFIKNARVSQNTNCSFFMIKRVLLNVITFRYNFFRKPKMFALCMHVTNKL